MLSGQKEPQIILGEQDLSGLPKDLRLVTAQPFYLGRGKPRKNYIARNRTKARVRVHLSGLIRATRVVPQHARIDGLIIRADKAGAVHMPRQADPLQPRAISLGSQRTKGLAHRGLPRGGALLSPTIVRPLHLERYVMFGQNILIVID